MLGIDIESFPRNPEKFLARFAATAEEQEKYYCPGCCKPDKWRLSTLYNEMFEEFSCKFEYSSNCISEADSNDYEDIEGYLAATGADLGLLESEEYVSSNEFSDDDDDYDDDW